MRNINGVRVELDGGVRHIPSRVHNLIANWNTDGSAELAGAPICEAYVAPGKVTLYASGYYFGCMGLVSVFTMAF